MKLVESRNGNLGREPKVGMDSLLPDFFYIQSSSTSVNNSFMTVRDGWGQVPIGKGVLAPRLFSITGNVEAESSAQVEKMRSSFMSKMFGKDLWLKVDDADDRWIWVRLDGAINITYNAGVRTSRVFTFSFTLKAPEGVSYGETRKEELIWEIPYGKQPVEAVREYSWGKTIIRYDGDIYSMPYFSFDIEEVNDSYHQVPFSIKRTSDTAISQALFRTTRFKAYILKEILPKKDLLRVSYKNGFLHYINKKDSYEYIIKDVSNSNLTRPLLLTPHRQERSGIDLPTILIDWSGVDSSKQYKMVLRIEWRPIYF